VARAPRDFRPIESARGHAVNQAGWYPAEDAVSASFAFESGAIGNGIWCFTLSPGSTIDRTDIVGAQGRITFSTFGLDQPLTLVRENGHSEEFLLPPPTHVQEPLIQTIVDALNGRGTCPSTGVSAARTSKVMDSVVASRT
jgi:predicted dehydrogenase